MPLEPVQTTETALANQIAQRIVNDITQTAQRVNGIRTNGLPAVAAQEERTLPDGRVIPARPEQPAVSPEAIDTALGVANCDLLNQIKNAIGI